MFAVKSNLIFWTSISFGILLFLLYRIALPPLFKLLEERRNLIQASLRQAEENNAKQREISLLYQQKIREAAKEAKEILSLTQKEARQLQSQVLQDAKRESSAIIQHANQQIEYQKSKIIKELKEKTADLVIEATKRIISKELDTQGHLKLIEESLEELEGQS